MNCLGNVSFDNGRSRRHNLHPALKQLPPPFVLRISGIPNLEPIHTILAVLALRYDSFEIPFTHQPEQIEPIAFDMTGKQNPGVVPDNLLERSLAFQQGQTSEIPATHHQAVEGVKDRLTTAAQKIKE